MDNYFVFDGKSSLDYGIVIDKLPLDNPAERDFDKQEIPKRDGILLVDNKKRKSKLKTIKAYITAETDIQLLDNISSIKKWLQTSVEFKKLSLSNELDYVYEAMCINTFEFSEVWDLCHEFIIIFECMPYKKKAVENVIYITAQNTVVSNIGEASNPYMKITGNGDFIININSQELSLKGVTSYIEIDCEMKNAFKTNSTTGIMTNENQKMYSDFPVLEKGNNTISWSGTGTISRIELLPRVVIL